MDRIVILPQRTSLQLKLNYIITIIFNLIIFFGFILSFGFLIGKGSNRMLPIHVQANIIGIILIFTLLVEAIIFLLRLAYKLKITMVLIEQQIYYFILLSYMFWVLIVILTSPQYILRGIS